MLWRWVLRIDEIASAVRMPFPVGRLFLDPNKPSGLPKLLFDATLEMFGERPSEADCVGGAGTFR